MRRNRFVLMALIAALAVTAWPALAANDDKEKPEITFTGEARVRWEYLSNVLDAEDHDSTLPDFLNDDFGYLPYLVRVGLNAEFSHNVRGVVQVQNNGYFGNDYPQKAPTGPVDQAYSTYIDNSEVQLYQAFIEMANINDSDWTLSIGRREHTLSNELQLGDDDFYAGQSFDGVRAMRHDDYWDLDLFWYDVVENDPDLALFSLSGNGNSDVTLTGATAGFSVGGDQRIVPYILYLRDGDYSAGGGQLYTIGAQYGRDYMAPENADKRWDWNAEAAIQTGTFEPNGADMDFGGSIFEGWFGYNMHGKRHSRVHIGVLWTSGDDDPADNDLNGYVSLFPDPHSQNRLGDLDLFGGLSAVTFVTGGMSNVTDINVGYQAWSQNHKRGYAVSVHQLELTEDLGLPDSDIGTELDLSYDYNYTSNLAFQIGIANLFSGDALAPFTVSGSTDDIVRAWWQARLTW